MARYVLMRKVLIAGPADTSPLLPTVMEVIHRWNAARPAAEELLLPLHWTKNLAPAFRRGGAQALINEQLLDFSDIVIALFRFRLGTPTSQFPAGTVEEIERHIKDDHPAMVYFSTEPVPRGANRDQFDHLQEFQDLCKDKGLMGEFSSEEDLALRLTDDLTKLVLTNPIDIVTKIRHTANSSPLQANKILHDVQALGFPKLELDDQGQMHCVTFRPRNPDPDAPGAWWEVVEDFGLPDHTEITKTEIRRHMEHSRDSFKFYLRVPKKRMAIAEYRTRLVNGDAVVTGFGDQDPDPARWRIWFLHPAGFIHPYMARSYLVNHSLFDLSGL